MLFLPIFNDPKTQLLSSTKGATFLIISPPGGSIFKTFAPKSANSFVQNAPEISLPRLHAGAVQRLCRSSGGDRDDDSDVELLMTPGLIDSMGVELASRGF